jgi:hypothetical protein
MRWSADFITDTSESEFSAHTRAPRIHGELLKLGFAVAQSTVAKYMAKNGDPSGQSSHALVGGLHHRYVRI